MNVIENLKPNQHKTQGFSLPPPPLHARKRKAPEDCFRSYIDQGTDGLYGGLKLVRNAPQTNRDIYFVVRTSTTQVRSNRRNKTHWNAGLFRTKKDGPTKANLEYLSCSFLELDGSTDNRTKTQEDVFTLINKNNLPEASYTIQTSQGHYHLIWTYNNPLPWNERNESYWTSQQKRLIQLFQKAGFNVDIGASTNPCQNLRNPSQLNPYNFKRRCQVEIHKSYKKTSLRAIYRALNKTSVPNPKRPPASTKLRRFLRANQTFTMTYREHAINLGTCTKTAQREVRRAVLRGDMLIVQRTGNNKGKTRTTEYISRLYIEPEFSERTHSISKDKTRRTHSANRAMLDRFKLVGAEKGKRNKTIFALGLYLKCLLGETASKEAIRGELLQGARLCHVSEREFAGILKSVMKDSYTNQFSLAKMREWGLLGNRKITEILH